MDNLKAVSYQQIINKVRDAWKEAHPYPANDGGSYVVDVYPEGYVIVNMWEGEKDEYFQISFTETDGNITFANSGEWESVERTIEWVAKSTQFRDELENEPVAFIGDVGELKAHKSEDGLLGYVEEIGVTFTDDETPDLSQDYFDQETYLGKRHGDGVDATLNHRIPIRTGNASANKALAEMANMIFTYPVKTVISDEGVIVQHVLDLSKKYEKLVFDLVQKGAFRWSAGSAPHLYDRVRKGNAFHVKRFDIIEWAYTPTAANPNNPRIRPVKSLPSELSDELVSDIVIPSEGAGDAPGKDGSNLITVNAENVFINQEQSKQNAVKTATEDQMKTKAESDNLPKNIEDVITAAVKTALEASVLPPKQKPDLAARVEAAVKTAFAELQEPKTEGNDEVDKIVDLVVKKMSAILVADNHGFAPSGSEAPDDGGNIDDDPEVPHAAMKKTYLANFHRFERGDNEAKALKAWMVTGDGGTVNAAQGIRLEGNSIKIAPLKASNDTIMNIAAAADGGNLVPTGHVNAIAARRDEDMLAMQLGCFLVPGVGTTVNHPFDNEADGEFVLTGEQVDAGTKTFDRDAPAVGKKGFTLAKYSKKVVLTDELRQDEASNLMAFLEDFVGRGAAKTHNSLLLTEVASNGTSLKTFSVATAIADGDLEDIEGDDDLGAYLDDDTVAWVMRNSTLSAIRQIGSTSRRTYAVLTTSEGPGVRGNRSLLGYPVFRSNKAAAIAASAKSVYFGNWRYVGYRLSPEWEIIRDPYTVDGELLLKYYFRTVYGVLIAEAIGYGVHGTATG